jgi:hypothetical protein
MNTDDTVKEDMDIHRVDIEEILNAGSDNDVDDDSISPGGIPDSEENNSESEEDDCNGGGVETVHGVEPLVKLKKTSKKSVKKSPTDTKAIAKAKKPKVEKPTSKKPKAVKTTTPKIKKPRTVRRPYKLLPQEKLDAKQAVTQGRFETLTKRVTSSQKLLEHLNFEVAFRKDSE